MPTIRFVGNEFGPEVSVDAPDGGALVDICDDAHAPVPFSCRSASCGTCRVRVLAGASHLSPPKQDELTVLEIFSMGPQAAPNPASLREATSTEATHRLACQAVALAGPGLVVLRSASDE